MVFVAGSEGTPSWVKGFIGSIHQFDVPLDS